MSEEEKKPILTRAQFEANIVAKAWSDPEYKKRLLANPVAVVEEELNAIRPGIKLPQTLQVFVHEETPNALHITLPMNPQDYAATASDEWMDDVAGGCFAAIVAVVVATADIMTAVGNVTVGANGVGVANVVGVGNAVGVANAVATVNVTV